MPAPTLPSLFIASSSEGLPVAHDLQEALEHDCHATIWPQGVLRPGRQVLAELLALLKRQQFALAVFTPDDLLLHRRADARVPRDNVVFELGLAIGLLGVDRCQFMAPRGTDAPRLPSDLAGMLGLDYPADRPDGNRLAGLGPACNRLRRWLRASADRKPVRPPLPAPGGRLARWLQQWNSEPLCSHRARLRGGITLDHGMPDEDRRSLRSVFHFLDGLADAVLQGEVDPHAARDQFGAALVSVWPWAAQLLAPPNHAGEAWDPPPPIATLYAQWRNPDHSSPPRP